jgi:hypothetical protein
VPETATRRPRGRESGNARSPDEALRRLIQKREAVPGGLLFFLPAGQAHMEGDTLVLELPPGPGLERLLAEPHAQKALESGFAAELGIDVTLSVRASGGEDGGSSPPRRLTPDRVRTDQLTRLAQADPLLGRAVERWDLELMD